MEYDKPFEAFNNNPSNYIEAIERINKSICTISCENTGIATAFFPK